MVDSDKTKQNKTHQRNIEQNLITRIFNLMYLGYLRNAYN